MGRDERPAAEMRGYGIRLQTAVSAPRANGHGRGGALEASAKAGKAGCMGSSCTLPRGPQRCAHKRVEQGQIYFEPPQMGTAGEDTTGAGPRRWIRASRICSHMARHRGTWKQPVRMDARVGRAQAARCHKPLQPRPALRSPLKGPPLMLRTTFPSRFR